MKLYAGFCDGKPDIVDVDDRFREKENWRRAVALFTSREDARCQYADVREVEIKEVKKVRKR
jgi:hypothetical protein